MVDFNTVIRDFHGNEVPATDELNRPKQKDGKPVFLTVGEIAINALGFDRPDEKTTEREKLNRFMLAIKIAGAENGNIDDLSSTDITKITELVSKFYPPLVCGRVIEALDPVRLKGQS